MHCDAHRLIGGPIVRRQIGPPDDAVQGRGWNDAARVDHAVRSRQDVACRDYGPSARPTIVALEIHFDIGDERPVGDGRRLTANDPRSQRLRARRCRQPSDHCENESKHGYARKKFHWRRIRHLCQRLDAHGGTCQRAAMALGILFTILACALVGVAWAAWQGGVLIIALGAIVLSGWLASLAVATFRRGRRPRA